MMPYTKGANERKEKMHNEGQWCKTVGELNEFLKGTKADVEIAMADLAPIYVIKEVSGNEVRGVIFTDMDDDEEPEDEEKEDDE
jgi:hypothetical protein